MRVVYLIKTAVEKKIETNNKHLDYAKIPMELSWRFCNELSLLVRRDHLLSVLRVEILEVQPLILPLARSIVFCLCCFRFRPASICFNENSI